MYDIERCSFYSYPCHSKDTRLCGVLVDKLIKIPDTAPTEVVVMLAGPSTYTPLSCHTS